MRQKRHCVLEAGGLASDATGVPLGVWEFVCVGACGLRTRGLLAGKGCVGVLQSHHDARFGQTFREVSAIFEAFPSAHCGIARCTGYAWLTRTVQFRYLPPSVQQDQTCDIIEMAEGENGKFVGMAVKTVSLQPSIAHRQQPIVCHRCTTSQNWHRATLRNGVS